VWGGKYASDGGLDHTNARIHDHGLSQRHVAAGKSKQHSLATAKLQQSELKWGDRERNRLKSQSIALPRHQANKHLSFPLLSF
jgi:hypothetical protein